MYLGGVLHVCVLGGCYMCQTACGDQCVCMWGGCYPCHSEPVDVRKELSGICSSATFLCVLGVQLRPSGLGDKHGSLLNCLAGPWSQTLGGELCVGFVTTLYLRMQYIAEDL